MKLACHRDSSWARDLRVRRLLRFNQSRNEVECELINAILPTVASEGRLPRLSKESDKLLPSRHRGWGATSQSLSMVRPLADRFSSTTSPLPQVSTSSKVFERIHEVPTDITPQPPCLGSNSPTGGSALAPPLRTRGSRRFGPS